MTILFVSILKTATFKTKNYSLSSELFALRCMGPPPLFSTIFMKGNNFCDILFASQGPVVQSIVSLTSSLKGQLIKCFTTLYPNISIVFVELMREAFALQKLLTFFQQKILAIFRY